MQILLTNKYVTFEYYPEQSLIHYFWTVESQLLKWAEFKAIMEEYKADLIRFKPNYILIDLRDFLFIISESQQHWIDTEINGTALKTGTKKAAILLPNDTYAQIAVELVMMEDMGSQLSVDFFQDSESAKKWLFE